MIDVRMVKSSADMRAFLNLPARLYASDPMWVPPLMPELKKHLSNKHNPFFDNGEAQLFVAWRGTEPVGRISAHIDHTHNQRTSGKTGFFGFFECINDVTVSNALFDTAQDWLRNRGMERVRGPHSFTINQISGILIDGFDTPPYIEMGHNLPYYQQLCEAAGFEKVKDLLAWRYDSSIDPNEGVQMIADQVAQYPGLVVREMRMSHFEEDLRIIMDIFNEAWSQNWGFVPMSDREVKKLADEMKMVIEPRMAFIAEVDGVPAAISLSVPNINQALLRARGLPTPLMYARLIWDLKVRRNISQARLMVLGVRKQFRGSVLGGLSVLLYCKSHWVGKSLGMKEAELSWTLDDNDKINAGIMMMGGEKYKVYRMFEKSLA